MHCTCWWVWPEASQIPLQQGQPLEDVRLVGLGCAQFLRAWLLGVLLMLHLLHAALRHPGQPMSLACRGPQVSAAACAPRRQASGSHAGA